MSRSCVTRVWLLLACIFVPQSAWGEDSTNHQGYQRAPEAIRAILDAPATPIVSLDPTRRQILLVQGLRYPPVVDLAQPMLRLAGYRINPRTNGPHQPTRFVSLTLQEVASGQQRKVKIPDDPYLGFPAWSPDGSRFAFTNTTEKGIELWIGQTDDGRISRVANLQINAAFGDDFQWLSGSRKLICQAVVADRGEPPKSPPAPSGPTIQETTGRAGQVRTHQDLLQSAHDEDLFDYYATSQLVIVDVDSGQVSALGKPGVFASVEPAPDGRHILVTRVHRPYSYLYPADAFPQDIEVWNVDGDVVAQLARLPLADNIPIEGVPTGPRSHRWQSSDAATILWVEALDGGDPRKEAKHRDRVLKLSAPFAAEPAELLRLEHRFAGMIWFEDPALALVSDYDRDRRWARTFLVDTRQAKAAPRLIWDRSILDRYNHPGVPAMRTLANGQRVIQQHQDQIFLLGQGATPEGDRPFLDRLDLKSLTAERLFGCADGCYESVVALASEDGSRYITRRESPNDPPNFLLHEEGKSPRTLTNFPDPAPQLRGIKKQLVTYQRADGVPLSFTLYLPADYQPGQRLPTIVWAYPREYTDPQTAGQVSGSPYHFTTIGGASHLFLLTQGYAILDGATMPIVGPPEKANDTYIEQLVSSAEAAIHKATELGVTDPHRVGVAGHSYGAFMTANLLAHSDLFRAGVARSGAYNRTLTPFGFQAERRTLWEAPETYQRMSPFMHAHQINEPLLLIHGDSDNNSGTFPIQSERMYQAIRGNGGTARLVMLPHESHGYTARESIEHTLYEMTAWFDRHVKAAPQE